MGGFIVEITLAQLLDSRSTYSITCLFLEQPPHVAEMCQTWWLPPWRKILNWNNLINYSNVIMGAMASQITNLTIVYSTVYLGADQRKRQSSASQTFFMSHLGCFIYLPIWAHRPISVFYHYENIYEYSIPLCDILQRCEKPHVAYSNICSVSYNRWV